MAAVPTNFPPKLSPVSIDNSLYLHIYLLSVIQYWFLIRFQIKIDSDGAGMRFFICMKRR
jgi:hypothetical protein